MRTSSSAAIYRPDLGQMVMEYVEDVTMQPIGLRIMPLFPVPEQSSTFPVIPKEALLKLPDTSRAPRGRYNRADWTYESGLYATHEKGIEEPIDDVERKLFDGRAGSGSADFLATRRAWNHIMRAQEKRIADMVFNATYFATATAAVTNEWDDATNATPIDDINGAKDVIRQSCGMLPNTLIIAWSTYQALKNCSQIVDRLKYTFPAIDLNRMTTAQLAAVFDVPQVLIGGAVYDSAGQGLPSNLSDIWSNEYAMLTRVSDSLDLTEPCIGRTFLWTEDSPQNPIVEQYRDEGIRSDVFRVRHHVDERYLTSQDEDGTVVSNIAVACSYLLSNITT